MGAIAAIAPIISAVGSLGSLFMGQDKPDDIEMPAPPKEEPGLKPEDALAAEQDRRRRLQGQNPQRSLFQSTEPGSVKPKTLLGG